ncbi:mitochondrial carrier domain-containing protein [Mycena leptocephala]|nr:mitochondrial carrier domain-containing protein [Mycena leptocephala]
MASGKIHKNHPFVVPQFTARDYSSFFAAGALCATISHGGMTPIDVVKTRIQIDPAYKGLGILSGTRLTIAKEGPAALLTGFGPTAVGYLAQGGAKFAGYEFWKKPSYKSRVTRTRCKIPHGYLPRCCQCRRIFRRHPPNSPRGYSNPFGLRTGLRNWPRHWFTRMAREGGLRELYAGFVPILCKQIPYAIGQFTVNEFCHELVFRSMSEETKRNLSATSKFGIAFGSGITAGFAAAILSHPADTLLSQINKGHGPSGSMVFRLTSLAREAGFKGLFAGLGPRMVMTAILVCSQFLMYGEIKRALGAPPGLEIHKED